MSNQQNKTKIKIKKQKKKDIINNNKNTISNLSSTTHELYEKMYFIM